MDREGHKTRELQPGQSCEGCGEILHVDPIKSPPNTVVFFLAWIKCSCAAWEVERIAFRESGEGRAIRELIPGQGCPGCGEILHVEAIKSFTDGVAFVWITCKCALWKIERITFRERQPGTKRAET